MIIWGEGSTVIYSYVRILYVQSKISIVTHTGRKLVTAQDHELLQSYPFWMYVHFTMDLAQHRPHLQDSAIIRPKEICKKFVTPEII